jgi:bisphosphoglycerate-dependent phosphoglycerate mutase
MRLFIFARHAESAANTARLLNSDPAHQVDLTRHGQQQARLLGEQLAHLQIDQAVCTRFLRTRQTISPSRTEASRCALTPIWTKSTPAPSTAPRSAPTGPGRSSTDEATASAAVRAWMRRRTATQRRCAGCSTGASRRR